MKLAYRLRFYYNLDGPRLNTSPPSSCRPHAAVANSIRLPPIRAAQMQVNRVRYPHPMTQKKKSQPHDPYAPVAKNPLLAARLPAWRSKFIVMLVFGAFATLAARAFWVQVVNQDFYVDQGQKRYQRTIELDATRGRIVDRNGSMLASASRRTKSGRRRSRSTRPPSRRCRSCSTCRSRICAGV
jgi:hypothetical protein